jgi:hypothetical protein
MQYPSCILLVVANIWGVQEAFIHMSGALVGLIEVWA